MGWTYEPRQVGFPPPADLPGPPGRRSKVALWLVVGGSLAGLALVVAVVGFLVVFGYYAGDPAHVRGTVTVVSADTVCVDDPHIHQSCLPREDIRLVERTAAVPDVAAIGVGQCLEYLAPKRFDHDVRVRVTTSCSAPTSTAPTTTR